MTDTRPGGQTPYSWQQVMMDTLNRIESRMLTRDEFSAHQQRFDGALSEMRSRIDEVQTRALTATSDWRAESISEHKELETQIEAVAKDIKEVRRERSEDERNQQKEASKRRFTVAMAAFGAGLSIITGIAVFILQGVFGG